jgi:hypothetical protein
VLDSSFWIGIVSLLGLVIEGVGWRRGKEEKEV